MRRFVRWMLLWVIGMSVWPVGAQVGWGTWEVMLYDNQAGVLTTLNSNGGSNELAMPLPPNVMAYPPERVAVSPDGSRVVYLVYRQAVEGVDGGANALVLSYDRNTGELAQYPQVGFQAHSLDFYASPAIFSPDGNQIAIAYTVDGQWILTVLDFASNAYREEVLSGQVPAMDGVQGAFTSFAAPIPIVKDFDGSAVTFHFIDTVGMDTRLTNEVYTWNVSAQTVTRTDRYNRPNFDVLTATGELIQATRVGTLPSASIDNLMPTLISNVLTVTDASNVRVPFYHEGAMSLQHPTFVTGGHHVAYEAIDTSNAHSWSVIDRSGASVTQLSAEVPGMALGIRDVIGTEFGALILADTAKASERLGLPLMGNETVLYADLKNGASPFELVYNTNPNGGYNEFVWIRNTYTSGIGGYAAWAQVPFDGIAGGIDESVAPTVSPATLAVGGQAEVFTTEGDALNMRSAPGTAFEVVARVPSGMQVTLLEGPISADGFDWWRVQIDANTTGWVVESADNVQTLQPR